MAHVQTNDSRGSTYSDVVSSCASGVDSARGPRIVATKRSIIEAAAKEFAAKPYGEVSLTHVTSAADVTKGALYAHFQSKRDLADAVVAQQDEILRATAANVLARQLSGLETLIELSFSIAEAEFASEMIRAGSALMNAMGRGESTQRETMVAWVEAYRRLVERAVAEGDIVTDYCPSDVGRSLMSLYVGVRQTTSPGARDQFMIDIARGWQLILHGIVPADKLAFFTRFLDRRLNLVIGQAPASRSAAV